MTHLFNCSVFHIVNPQHLEWQRESKKSGTNLPIKDYTSTGELQGVTFLSRKAPRAWQRPTVVVDFPSPSGVGLIPPTTT